MALDNLDFGDDEEGFVKLETTYGTAVKPTATDAIRVVSMPLAPTKDRPVVNDRRDTRSRMETFEGREGASWGITTLMRPSAALGTAPDFNDLLKLIFGTETINAGVDVQYSLKKDMTALMASLYRKYTNHHECVYGAIGQSLTIAWTGNGPITFEFAGIAKNFTRTGNDAANGAGTAATALIVDQLDYFGLFSIVKIGSDDNSAAGWQFTAVDHSIETATLESAHTWSDNDTVVPFLPSPTHTGDPLFGSKVTVSLDNGSTTLQCVGGSITIATGLGLLNEEGGDSDATDVTMEGQREVDISLDFLLRKDESYLIEEFDRKVTKDIQIILGDTATKKCTVDADKVEFDPSAVELPESGPGRFSVAGKALGTSGEDELKLTWA